MWWWLAACAGTGTKIDDDAACEASTAPVDVDEVGPGGVSAVDAYAALMGTYDDTLAYEEGGQTALTLEMVLADASMVTLESVDGDRRECGVPFLLSGLDLTLNTGDGAFAEAWHIAVQTTGVAASVSFFATIPTEDLGGSYSNAEMDFLRIDGALNADGTTSGTLTRQWTTDDPYVTGTDGESLSCPIGAWGGALTEPCS